MDLESWAGVVGSLESASLDGGANLESRAGVVGSLESASLDGGAYLQSRAIVVRDKRARPAASLDRALHLQADRGLGRRRGLHDRYLPHSLVEKTFRERLTVLQRPCHGGRDKSDQSFPGFSRLDRGAAVTTRVPGSVTSRRESRRAFVSCR
jgi:hypothetical protein